MKYSLKFKLKMINLKKEGKPLEYPTVALDLLLDIK